jgi:TH1 protein
MRALAAPAGSLNDSGYEFTFLAHQVRASFDPAALAGVFSGGAPPAWAQELTRSKRGRALVYDLAARHAGSLFLGWLLKRILADGHDEEVARTGHHMASYFGVFHRCDPITLKGAQTAVSKE